MTRLIRSHHFYVDVTLAALFWTVAPLMQVSFVLLLTNSFVLSASTAVAVAYLPAAWEAVRGIGDPDTQHIRLGIVYHWAFTALWRIWSLFWIMSGQPPWMVNNYLVAFLQAGVVLGAGYHLTSVNAFGTDKPGRKWLVVGAVSGVAMFVAVCLAAFSPDTRFLAEAIRPYVPGAE